MKKPFIKFWLLYSGACMLLACNSLAQETTITDSSELRVVIAGHYQKSKFHQWLFGRHYRKEWAIPVRVKNIDLDTTFGGLRPYQAGGGRQSKTLRLRDTGKHEYVLRSLDKSFGRALPDVLQGTFVEDLIDDQVTIAHPYAAFTIPSMAQAAGIYHTNPVLRFVPTQPALDTFNNEYGNHLYLLEQRPDEDWSDAANFGNSSNIIGTEKLFEKLAEKQDCRVDQLQYVRCRLFDMLIGDWGRHEDQWRWASFKDEDYTLYRPVPRDRDQAYTKFDGVFVKLVLSAANLDHLQTFRKDIEDVKSYNFTARHLDRRMANEVTKQQWLSIASELQQSLTDSIIESSIKQLPHEVYPVSGDEIADKLKSRRDHLTAYAEEYYNFIARHVDIPGTSEKEYFEVRRLNNEETSVKVYSINNDTANREKPLYARIFKTNETKDIRLYGNGNKDVFDIAGSAKEGITIRIIGGADSDKIIDHAMRAKTIIYDNKNNDFDINRKTKLRLSSDSLVHLYDYNEFEYHKKGLKFSFFYDNPDRIYIGTGYAFKRHMWRKEPYGFEQAFYLRYSLSQNAFSLLYDARFTHILGKWNGRIWVNQDFIRWTNFYGLGNETVNNKSKSRRYYQLRTDEFLGSLSLYRQWRKHHNMDVTAFFSAVEIINDAGRFVSENYTPNQLYFFEHHKYAGGRLGYTFQSVDNALVPQKGIMLYAGAAFTQNVEEWDKNFATYNGILQLYVPFIKKVSLSIRGNIASIDGHPEFYQYASIGGSQSLRGFRRDRFWGKTAFYNSNELRWITDFKSYVMNGKIGIVAFIDDGRVWMPGEISDKWHVGYGGGFLLAPFNMFSSSVTYGLSEEGGRLHIRVSRLLSK